MRELALFAGAGGGILGGQLLGWRTVCAVEINDYCQRVLMQRQNDGILEPFPIWPNVTTFDGKPWAGCVDIVTGGFPCQDISAAGKGAGIEGERSGLWAEMARIIGEVRPRYALVENSPMLTLRGLDRVLGELATLGYDAQWGVLGADDVGAPHIRKRIWILAHTPSFSEREPANQTNTFATQREAWNEPIDGSSFMANSYSSWQPQPQRDEQAFGGWFGDSRKILANDTSQRCGEGRAGRFDPGHSRQPQQPLQLISNAYRNKYQSRALAGEGQRQNPQAAQLSADTDRAGLEKRQGQPGNHGPQQPAIIGADWWATEPELGRVVNGVAHRVDRIKAIGNGQVPAVAATAFQLLLNRSAP